MNLITQLKNKTRKLKEEMHILNIAYLDSRTPWPAKVVALITVGYLLSPIDLIPDFIPVLGLVDDLILVPLLIKLSIQLIPAEVIKEARDIVKNRPQTRKKKNRIVAIVIVSIWIIILYTVASNLKLV